jgi:sulfur-carrier protein
MTTILIPEQLRKSVEGQTELQMEVSSIADFIAKLSTQYPLVVGRLIDPTTNTFNKFINVYVNGEDIRFLQSVDTPIKDGDEVSIVPSNAGG